MRSDQRYLVREAIRREQGEPVRREVREYDRDDGEDEPPRRESREYERRDYRAEPPSQTVRERQPYPVREREADYSRRERRPAYADREAESDYSRREEREPYVHREPTPRRPIHQARRHRENWPVEEQHEEAPGDEPVAPAWFAVTRATAFFLGSMTLLNLLGEMRFPHFAAAGWWIDLQSLPKPASRGLLALSAVLLVAFALFPRANNFVRRLGALSTLGLLVATGWAAYRFYRRDHAGQPAHDLPVPFSLHLAALLLVALAGQMSSWWKRTNFFKDFLVGMVTLAVCVASLPLAQIFCLGRLDDHSLAEKTATEKTVAEKTAADAAVVFAGSIDAQKSSDDKSPPNLLQTACKLYREGKVKKLLLMGRPDQTAVSEETRQALRNAALAEGVPESDLLGSVAPGDSRNPIADSMKVLDEKKLSHALIIARFYEIPRIKLSFQRTGIDARCLPIHEDVRSPKMRPVLLREAAALWVCHLQPILM
jgi:vancomycin permeability regulator SanA